MALIEYKCPNCDANLKSEEGNKKVVCPYCSAQFTIEDIRSQAGSLNDFVRESEKDPKDSIKKTSESNNVMAQELIKGEETTSSGPVLGKLVAKTALFTLAGILALVLILFGVFTIFFPSVMVTVSDKLGMDKVCTYYAVSVYNRSNDISDLADVVERGYQSHSWGTVSKYGKKLINRKDFGEFCDLKDIEAENGEEGALIAGTYDQYIVGLIAEAMYRQNDEENALDTAFYLNREVFPANNAVVSLSLIVMNEGDVAFAERIYEELNTLYETVNFDSEEDGENLEMLIGMMRDFISSEGSAAEAD